MKRDRRTAREILVTPRWRALRAVAEDRLTAGALTIDGLRKADKWLAYVAARGVQHATKADYLAFDAASQTCGPLCQLQEALTVLAPGAPDLRALDAAVTEKRAANPPAYRKTGRPPGARRRVSVSPEQLPADWQAALADMRAGRRRRTRAPAPSIVTTIEGKLGQLAWSAGQAGVSVALDTPALAAFLADMEARGLRATTMVSTLEKLKDFARYIGADHGLTAALDGEIEGLREESAGRPKRKETFLFESGLTLTHVASLAAARLAAAATEPNRKRRHARRMSAALFALMVCRPLRAADIGRLVLGETLRREDGRWRLDLVQQKTKLSASGPLPDALTPYLDAALLGDTHAPARDRVYAARAGQPFFVTVQGTPYGYAWATLTFKDAFGIGIHINRTLCYEAASLHGETGRAIAAALCGHAGPSSGAAYETARQQRQQAELARDLFESISNKVCSYE